MTIKLIYHGHIRRAMAMRWKIAEAKQRLSAVVKAAQKEPQLIANRDELVAAVVSYEAFEEYCELLERSQQSTLGESYKELRQICESECYELVVPERENRSNPMVEALEDVPR
jgi:prevent-host-death family protein